MKARVLSALSLALLVSRSAAAGPPGTDPLRTFSDAIEALVKRVSPSVVQVLVTGYGPLEETDGNTDLVIGRQRSIGSGAVIDADGYVVTNAHVIAGGQRIEVVLPGAAADEAPMRSLTNGRGRVVEAHVVGVATEVDLALLKVDASGLPAMKVADYDALRTGELVFAFGSPEGLRNSVTMGVVSAVARQPDPDHPMVYIQTDAPINRGNSGGPLVNASLYFYYEVYDPARASAAAAGATSAVKVVTSLTFFRNKVRVFETPPVEASALNGTDRQSTFFQFDLPASSLPQGLYTCQVNIIDDVAGTFAFPRLQLYVRR